MAESMPNETYELFRSVAGLGMRATLYLKADGQLKEKQGIIRKILDSGVLIQSSQETTFVSAEALATFTIAQQDNDVTEPALRLATSDRVDGSSERGSPQVGIEGTPGDSGVGIRSEDTIDESEFASFLTPVQLSSPKPVFRISDLSQDDRSEVTRWKNRYDYAIKIGEITRIKDDIKPIGRLAKRLRLADLYLLAGIIAIESQSYELAAPQLTNAVALGSARAAVALTWLACLQGDASKAFEMACRATTIDSSAFGNQEESVLSLGRLLARLDNKDSPGITDAVASLAGTEANRLANAVIAFALKEIYPAAAKAALSGQITDAKLLAPDARAFQSLPLLTVSPSRPTDEPQPLKSGAANIEEFGRITAAYPEKSCGFLINEVTHETLFFAFSYISDPDLLEEVEAGLVGHKVFFSVRPIIKPYDTA
jgi:hypothetical protein